MSVFRQADTSTPAPAPAPVAKTAEPTVDNPLTPGGKSTVDTKVSDLFATYEQDQGKPFVADYFDVGNVLNEEPTLARDLKEIEGYVRAQVEGKKIDNHTRAAGKFMKQLERDAGLTTYEATPNRIQKILAYIDFKKVVNS